MKKDEFFRAIKHRLIVSCQAEGDSPFNSPEGVLLFAKAAKLGGAAAIRSEGFEKTKMIKSNIELPVIGLIKSKFPDGSVRITGSFSDIEKLIDTGCDVFAIDGTERKREGVSGPDFIKEVKRKYNCIVMADIASVNEGIKCADAGADCISTTLSGYTPETKDARNYEPDYKLLSELLNKTAIPVIAEGRISTPAMAEKVIQLGAWAAVVGSAITRPVDITKKFAEAVETKNNR